MTPLERASGRLLILNYRNQPGKYGAQIPVSRPR